ncbi:MAG: hypothetical protein HC895_16685, partial [Leptolyngbyaceae cyanobacterium SM1_3_5]|nr:hypothetical protein [Leptolyngbyaceae cyanobacterium SM1_3_5]
TQSSFGQVDKITLNVIQSCCDTVTQKIAKNKPKPTFLTSGGDWTMQKRAKLLDKYVVGQFYALNLYKKGLKAFHGSTIFGTGAVKFYKADGKVCAENVFIVATGVKDHGARFVTRSPFGKQLRHDFRHA